MSKLIDRLKQQELGAAKPIGFGRVTQASTDIKLLLVVSVNQTHIEKAADFTEGADALLLRISSSDAKKFEPPVQAVPDIPWGVRLECGTIKKIQTIEKGGSDFIVFPATGTLLTIVEDKVGTILELEKTISEGLLRAANELPVDAVLIAEKEGDKILTWHDLMLFQRSADLLTKPLLVSIPPEVTADELQAIWDAGVKAVVIQITPEKAPGKIKELRQAIDRLVAPSIHRKKRLEPVLPRLRQEPASFTVEEEDEDE